MSKITNDDLTRSGGNSGRQMRCIGRLRIDDVEFEQGTGM